MSAFIKKWWKPIALAAAILIAVVAGKWTYDLLDSRATSHAKAIYEAKVAGAKAAELAALAERDRLAEKAGREREESRVRADAEMRKVENVFAIFKSETAEELKARDAKIEEVLREKGKDEIVITEAREIIGTLYVENKTIREEWALSDERIAFENKKAMDALTMQFVTCKEWTARLEKKLRPTFWGRVKEGAKCALVFSAGYTAGKML